MTSKSTTVARKPAQQKPPTKTVLTKVEGFCFTEHPKRLISPITGVWRPREYLTVLSSYPPNIATGSKYTVHQD